MNSYEQRFLNLILSGNFSEIMDFFQVHSGQIDIEIKSEKGVSFFDTAIRKGYFEILQLLIQNGANPNKRNLEGKTAFQVILSKSYHFDEETIKILIKKLIRSGCEVGVLSQYDPQKIVQYRSLLVSGQCLEQYAKSALQHLLVYQQNKHQKKIALKYIQEYVKKILLIDPEYPLLHFLNLILNLELNDDIKNPLLCEVRKNEILTYNYHCGSFLKNTYVEKIDAWQSAYSEIILADLSSDQRNFQEILGNTSIDKQSKIESYLKNKTDRLIKLLEIFPNNHYLGLFLLEQIKVNFLPKSAYRHIIFLLNHIKVENLSLLEIKANALFKCNQDYEGNDLSESRVNAKWMDSMECYQQLAIRDISNQHYIDKIIVLHKKVMNYTNRSHFFWENLVFEGGGVKGTAYPGALSMLAEKGLLGKIRRLAGASAGSIVAGLLSVGHSNQNLNEILVNTSFLDFLDGDQKAAFLLLNDQLSAGLNINDLPNLLQKLFEPEEADILSRFVHIARGESAFIANLPFLLKSYFSGNINILVNKLKDNINSISESNGLFNGEAFRLWFISKIDEQLAPILFLHQMQAETLTFQQLHWLTKQYPYLSLKDLYVVGTNISTKRLDILSYEHTPDAIIADAVRISMSIPFVFKPHKLYRRNRHGERVPDALNHLYVDGGVLDNFPSFIFDKGNRMNIKTLGLRVDPPSEIEEILDVNPTGREYQNFLSYGSGLFSAITSMQNLHHQRAKEWCRTIYIDTGDVGCCDFNLTERQVLELIAAGHAGALYYLDLQKKFQKEMNENNRLEKLERKKLYGKCLEFSIAQHDGCTYIQLILGENEDVDKICRCFMRLTQQYAISQATLSVVTIEDAACFVIHIVGHYLMSEELIRWIKNNHRESSWTNMFLPGSRCSPIEKFNGELEYKSNYLSTVGWMDKINKLFGMVLCRDLIISTDLSDRSNECHLVISAKNQLILDKSINILFKYNIKAQIDSSLTYSIKLYKHELVRGLWTPFLPQYFDKQLSVTPWYSSVIWDKGGWKPKHVKPHAVSLVEDEEILDKNAGSHSLSSFESFSFRS